MDNSQLIDLLDATKQLYKTVERIGKGLSSVDIEKEYIKEKLQKINKYVELL